MHLLIVTDHRFYDFKGEIYDNYVFHYDFFLDYLKVFDKVTVLGRAKVLSKLPREYKKTSGENLDFIKIPDSGGVKYLITVDSILKNINLNLSQYDALCFRIPSILAFGVWKINNRTSKLPYMFEFIGDPKLALINENDRLFKKLIFKAVGNLMEYRMKLITKQAACGSYVSFKHLQNKFPVKHGVLTEVISSIRLDGKYIFKELPFIKIKMFNIIHIGSFVSIKNHNFLIEFMAILKQNNIDARLVLLGDGALKEDTKRKAIKLGVDSNIVFEGHITGFDNIVNYLDNSNVFILPSFSEGMPRALIEAMARGLICFGSNRGGISELLSQEFLFEPTKPEFFFSNFIKVVENEELINQSRMKNFKMVRNFEQSLLTTKRESILKTLKSQIK